MTDQFTEVLRQSQDQGNLLENEAQLVWGGFVRFPAGMIARTLDAGNHKIETAAEVAGAVGIGAALAFCTKNPETLWGVSGLLVKAANPVMTCGILTDLSMRLGEPILQVAKDPTTLEAQKKQLGNNLGGAFMDYTVMRMAGYAGSRAQNIGSELRWRTAPQPLAAESQAAARAVTDDLRGLQSRLPDPCFNEFNFGKGLSTKISADYSVNTAKGENMAASWQAGNKIPERISDADFGRFEKELSDSVAADAWVRRDNYIQSAGKARHLGDLVAHELDLPVSGEFPNRTPHLQLGDELTASAADSAGIDKQQFANLLDWHSAFGNYVPTLNITPGQTNFSAIDELWRPVPLPSLAPGVAASIADTIRHHAQ